MLQLQLKSLLVPKLSKKTVFFIKLFFFCTAVHASLMLLFFAFSNNRKNIFITLADTSSMPVVFVPLIKTTAQPKQSVPMSKKVQPVSVQKPIAVKKVEQKKIIPPKLVKEAPSVKKPSTVVTKKTVKQEKKPLVPVPPKKEIQPKKVAPVEVKPLEKAVPTPPIVANPMQEVLVLGRDDKELYELSADLKKDIVKVWKRPAGIPLGVECQALIKFLPDGTREVIIEKSSMALALDSSVRNFLQLYEFPQEVKGKNISIVF